MNKKNLFLIVVILAMIGIAGILSSCAVVVDPLSLENGNEAQAVTVPAVDRDPDWLLPDLLVLAPSGLLIEINDDGERELRFATAIINIGDGPLEMIGVYDEERDQTRAIQNIYTRQDSVEEVTAGYFVFHEDHDHWHFEGFVEIEVFSLDSAGSPDQMVATTEKMSFCIFDMLRLSPPQPGSPETAVYQGCDPEIQGLSVGWADVYTPDLPGQQINIENLPDGRYQLRATIDPEERILETIDRNNSSSVRVEIRGMEISVINNN